MQKASGAKEGKLKIYIGMSAGVGKTYAMLNDAMGLRAKGVDIVLGYIESHGRVETDKLTNDFEKLPLKIFDYKGVLRSEFDLDEALKRKPQLILVDELAHTNDPGSKHLKRYQDIEELLRHGIDVWTTVNIQHLESLNDIVKQTTGVEVKETVPDQFMLSADEVEIIDISPDDLRQRIREGKVYQEEKITSALDNFFKQEALLILRELALRYVADRVGREVWKYRNLGSKAEIWPTKERILVCVAPDALSTKVVREARRIATASNADLLALSVETPKYGFLDDEVRKRSANALNLARQLGAEVITRSGSDIVGEIIGAAREQNVTRIVIGKPPILGNIIKFKPSLIDRLILESGEIGLHLVSVNTPLRQKVFTPFWKKFRIEISESALVLLLISVLTLVLMPFYDYFRTDNIAMFFLLPTIICALKLGRRAALLSAILSVLFLDFFFVPPFFTFRVFDIGHIITFAVTLFVGLVIANLASKLKAFTFVITEKERRTAELYKISSEMNEVLSEVGIERVLKNRIRSLFKIESRLFLKREKGFYESGDEQLLDGRDRACVDWVLDNGLPAGKGTDTLSGNDNIFMPVVIKDSVVGVLSLAVGDKHFTLNDFELLGSLISTLANSLERIRNASELNLANNRVEEQKIRNSFLSAVSHDLRTPLATIEGASTTLLQNYSLGTQEDSLSLLKMICDQSQRLSRMISNILDITRLESGNLKLNCEWHSLEELIEIAFRNTEFILKDREVNLVSLEKLPLIKVDAVLMGQVFINLLENFAKYTNDSSSMNISGRVDGDSIEIVFEDDGPGLPRVGEKLNFSDNSFKEVLPGLGLSICSAIVHTHSGNFVYSKSEMGGAKFVISLPTGGEVPEVVYE